MRDQLDVPKASLLLRSSEERIARAEYSQKVIEDVLARAKDSIARSMKILDSK